MKTNMRDKPLIDIKLQRNCIDSERGAFALFFPKFTIWKDHRNSLFWWPDLESRECWSHLYSLALPSVHYCSKNVLFFPSKPVLLQHLLAVDWGENRIRFPVSILQPPIFFFQNEKKWLTLAWSLYSRFNTSPSSVECCKSSSIWINASVLGQEFLEGYCSILETNM